MKFYSSSYFPITLIDLLGGISCPIHYTFTEEAIIHIINQTKLSCVFVSFEFKEKFLQCSVKCTALKHLIVIDTIRELNERMLLFLLNFSFNLLVISPRLLFFDKISYQ